MSQLMLLFRVGTERFALETHAIVEIIHRVELERNHGTSTLVGRFNYHGEIVPVLDTSQLLAGSTCQAKLGTRIVLINLTQAEQTQKIFGLLVEQVTETVSIDQFSTVGEVTIQDARESAYPYLGRTWLYEQKMIQCLHADKLLDVLTLNTH
ncbi:MAG: chemotaxis protein CheW [Cyanobacteria bacterium J06643_4]